MTGITAEKRMIREKAVDSKCFVEQIFEKHSNGRKRPVKVNRAKVSDNTVFHVGVYMPHVTATEFQQNVGSYSDAALREPVVITSHNRERLVLVDIQEYKRLKALDSQAEDDTEALIKQSIDSHRSTLEKLAQK